MQLKNAIAIVHAMAGMDKSYVHYLDVLKWSTHCIMNTIMYSRCN